jgi:hypothetical protein
MRRSAASVLQQTLGLAQQDKITGQAEDEISVL